jgi:hypothetical protein
MLLSFKKVSLYTTGVAQSEYSATGWTTKESVVRFPTDAESSPDEFWNPAAP